VSVTRGKAQSSYQEKLSKKPAGVRGLLLGREGCQMFVSKRPPYARKRVRRALKMCTFHSVLSRGFGEGEVLTTRRHISLREVRKPVRAGQGSRTYPWGDRRW